MKKIQILCIAISVLFFIESSAQLTYSLSNKFWRLKYAKIDGKEYSFNSSNNNGPTLQFSGGNIRGNGGCNAYHTKFTIDGYTMSVSPVMSTRMACSDMYLDERTYFNSLSQTQTIYYTDGSSDLKFINTNGDQLLFFAQFSRSSESMVPPANRTVPVEREYVPRSSRHHAVAAAAAVHMTKKELARQRDLERKKKRGKISAREKTELKNLQKKSNEISRTKVLEKKAKRGKLSRRERNELKTLHKKTAKVSRKTKSTKKAKAASASKRKKATKGKKKARR